MLPDPYHQSYSVLRQSLQDLKAIQRQDKSLGSQIQPKFQTIQQVFQHCLNLSLDELEPAQAAQVQSFQTEINKQLRLLSMDIMFLRSARQSTTANQRQQQMSDRIDMLMRYCDALLNEPED